MRYISYSIDIDVLYQGNMGFLLHDPVTTEKAAPSSDEDDNSADDAPFDPLDTPKRKLQIPCTHGVLVQNLESSVAQLRSWPYTRQLTLDSLMAEFAT